MKILILSGSVRTDRNSHRLSIYLKNKLESDKHEAKLFDLKENSIPLLEDIYSKLDNPNAALKALKNELDKCDHIIVVTPEYNGHFSSAIKNAMDHFKTEYKGKVIGLSTVSSGKMGGIRASIHMQSYILALGAYPIPRICTTPEVQKLFNEEGQLLDSNFERSIDSFLNEFYWLATAVTEKLSSST